MEILLTKFAGLSPILLGAFFSIILSNKRVSAFSNAISFLFSVTVAYFIGNAVLEYYSLDLSSYISKTILFVFGMFGVTILREFYKNLPDSIKKLQDILLAIVEKMTGK